MIKTNILSRTTGFILAAAFFLIQGISAQSGDYVTFQHRNGETKVKKGANRVVIFDIGSLETYQELDIPVFGVTNSVPAYLPEYQSDRYQKLGSIMSPDLEALRTANPDLIIISGRQNKVYQELSEIAPTVFLGTDPTNYWESFEKNVRFIAEVHGKEALAEEKLAELRRKRDLVRAKTATDDSRTFTIMHVRGGHTAYGKESRFGFPHDVLGLREATSLDAQTHTGHRFKEGDGLVQKANPDYVLLIDRDSAVGGGKRKPTDELLSDELKQTNAYKNNKVVDLPGNIWYISGGGLFSVEKQITDIGESLYGIRF